VHAAQESRHRFRQQLIQELCKPELFGHNLFGKARLDEARSSEAQYFAFDFLIIH
jgi:hypothetical protein